jgi:hypothetical protein
VPISLDLHTLTTHMLNTSHQSHANNPSAFISIQLRFTCLQPRVYPRRYDAGSPKRTVADIMGRHCLSRSPAQADAPQSISPRQPGPVSGECPESWTDAGSETKG